MQHELSPWDARQLRRIHDAYFKARTPKPKPKPDAKAKAAGEAEA